MSGFGSGEFGSDPFGQDAWSREVLYDSIPEVYKAEDTTGLLKAFTEGLRPAFDNLRYKVINFDDLRDPLAVRSQYDGAFKITLGPRLVQKGTVQQRGIDGYVESFTFSTPTGRFTQEDAGKELEVFNSANPANNRVVTVAQVMTPTAIRTSPALSEDEGLLRWELRALPEQPKDITTVEVLSGDMSPVAPGWKLWDGYSEFNILSRHLLPSRTLREGVDGSLSWDGTHWIFNAPTAGFTPADFGRRLSFSGTVLEQSTGVFEIIHVYDSDNIALDYEFDATEFGPLAWAVLPRPTLVLRGPATTLKGVVEQHGFAASYVGGVITLPTAKLLALDVGKLLTIRGTGDNTETLKITAVLTATTCEVNPAPSIGGAPYAWEIRTKSQVGDQSQVEARSTSLIELLARDFAIEVEREEPDNRQRSWVSTVSRWTNIKGLDRAYKILAAISGFDADVKALWRIDSSVLSRVPEGSRYELSVRGRGMFGTEGAVTNTGVFTQAAGTFKKSDIGSYVRINNSSIIEMDGLWKISGFTSATTVQLDGIPAQALTGLEWRMVRPYTELPPERTDIADVNVANAQALNPNFSGEDEFAWEAGAEYFVPCTITVVEDIGAPVFKLTVPDMDDVILRAGRWRIVDSNGTALWVEPETDFVNHQIVGVANELPVAGPAALEYVPPVTMTCTGAPGSYCGSNLVLAVLTEGSVLGDPESSIASSLDRVFRRLGDVTPAHVGLIPRFRRTFEAPLAVTATWNPVPERFATFIAPLTRMFDDFVADSDELPYTEYGTDVQQLVANVESTWIDINGVRHPITE